MTLRALFLRLRAIVRRSRAEAELGEELQFHIEQETALLQSRGIPPAEARRQALVAFGGLEHTKEQYRDGRGDRWLTDLRSDLVFAFRLLRRNPSLTATVVLTLSVGIGASVAIFSAVNAVVLRPLPVSEPDRLVALWEDNADKGWVRQSSAPANMLDWSERVRAFDGVTAWADYDARPVLSGSGDPQALHGAEVMGNFFDVLRGGMTLGRGFAPDAHWLPAPRQVVVSHRFWQRQFGSDTAIIGRTLVLDRESAEVVGVAGPEFRIPAPDVDVWYPMRWDRADRQQVWFRRAHWLRPVARLRAETNVETASAELQRVMGAMEREYPETNVNMKAGLGPLHDYLVGDRRQPLVFLLASTGLLLLIGCANVANLLLVRAAAREQEVVVRRALGADRSRVVRQALTESMVLAVLGAAGGWLVGLWGTRMFGAWQPVGMLPVTDRRPDGWVFLFVVGVAALSAVVFGTAPALWVARRDAADALRSSTRMSSDNRRARRLVNTLAIGEVALAVTLTIGAGLLLRSYQQLANVDPGFEADGVASAFLAVGGTRYEVRAQRMTFVSDLLTRVRTLPGVESAAISSAIPFVAAGYTSDFSIRGRPADQAGREVRHRSVTDDYFRTMKVPLLAGRVFGPEDTPTSEPVTIINKALADRYFGNEDPIGQYIAGDLVPDSTSIWRRVVGVVGNERGRIVSQPAGIELTGPYSQEAMTGVYLVVRTSGDPANLLRSVARTISEIDPLLAPITLTTMPRMRSEAMARDRFMALLLAAFAAIGALLAVIGVYGVVAQAAQRREPELAIRLALGARPRHLHWLVLRHGLSVAALGAALGAAAAMAGSGVIRTMLFNTSRMDPAVYAVVVLLVLGAAAIASWLPAHRVVRERRGRSLSR